MIASVLVFIDNQGESLPAQNLPLIMKIKWLILIAHWLKTDSLRGQRIPSHPKDL